MGGVDSLGLGLFGLSHRCTFVDGADAGLILLFGIYFSVFCLVHLCFVLVGHSAFMRVSRVVLIPSTRPYFLIVASYRWGGLLVRSFVLVGFIVVCMCCMGLGVLFLCGLCGFGCFMWVGCVGYFVEGLL